jgi:hypothetical protein
MANLFPNNRFFSAYTGFFSCQGRSSVCKRDLITATLFKLKINSYVS